MKLSILKELFLSYKNGIGKAISSDVSYLTKNTIV